MFTIAPVNSLRTQLTRLRQPWLLALALCAILGIQAAEFSHVHNVDSGAENCLLCKADSAEPGTATCAEQVNTNPIIVYPWRDFVVEFQRRHGKQEARAPPHSHS